MNEAKKNWIVLGINALITILHTICQALGVV